MERVAQPTDTSCWDACVSMLTGIDIEMFPLNHHITPQITTYRKYLLFGERLPVIDTGGWWKRWVELLLVNGFDMRYHDAPPQGRPYMMALLVIGDNGKADGHAIVVDEDGIIFDPAPHDIINGKGIDILEKFCNVLVPKHGYITITKL